MKKEWKPEELRQTSEEIRGATLAKSITPEMVGGTLSGLTEALAEVVDVLGEIPREHVTVKVHGCDCNGLVLTAGATVEVEIFSVQGFPVSRPIKSTLETDDNCEVTFDVPHGFTFSVVAKCAGMGASFQLVQDATRKSRTIDLWCFPVGIFWYGQAGLWGPDYYNPSVPFLSEQYSNETDTGEEGAQGWINEYAAGLTDSEEPDYGTGEVCWRGILVSTADTAFVIMPEKLSEETMMWSDTFGFGLEVPFCANFNPDDMEVAEGEDPWEKARDLSLTDFDGYANTAKLLKHCVNPIAAKAAASMAADWWDQHNFLPSAGQLYLMWQNRTAINALMTAANDDGWIFKLLPYTDSKGSWVNPNGHYEYWWSSTQAGPNCSWLVNYDGGISYDNRSTSNDVRAVSAFHFEY